MKLLHEGSEVCLIGNRETFAIECELFPTKVYDDYHPMGVLYLWVAGHRLGDLDEDCMLSVPAATLLNQWRRRGTLHDPALDGEESTSAFAKFYRARYTEEALSNDEEDYMRWARLEVCPLGEQAHDGWLAIFLEGPAVDRFIWRGPDDETVRVAFLPPGQFHSIAAEFICWLAERSPWFRLHYENNRNPIPPGA